LTFEPVAGPVEFYSTVMVRVALGKKLLKMS